MKSKFQPDISTCSAIGHSVAYMMNKDSTVRLMVYHYKRKEPVDGDGKIFNSLDSARKFAFERGYIVPDRRTHEEEKKN